MSKALLAALVLVGFALSGCAGGGGGGSETTTTSSTTTSTGPPPPPPVYSDLVHWLAPPETALVLPEGSLESETGTAGGFGPGGGNDEPEAQWAYVVTRPANVTAAEVHVWVKIVDNLVQTPQTPIPFGPFGSGCTWGVGLQLGADAEEDFACLVEPAGLISPTTKELVFQFDAIDAELELNETITMRFFRQVFSPTPNDSVLVLSGTPAHDSFARLTGLQQIVPAGTPTA